MIQGNVLPYDWWTLISVLLCIAFVCSGLWLVSKVLAGDPEYFLIRVSCLLFSAVVLVWICDKVIVVRRDLLSEQQSEDIFKYVWTVLSTVFGVIFGQKLSKKDIKKDDSELKDDK